MKILILTLTSIILFVGCGAEYKDDPYCKKYKVYTIEELRDSIDILPPKEIKNIGKIYIYKNLILVNEPNLGIHIIDNNNRKNPINKAFLLIMGNIDMAVKDGYLYADSFMDMVVFDIRDLDNIAVVNRVKDIFEYDKNQVLEDKDRFRCEIVDDNDSVVLGLRLWDIYY